MKFVKEPSPLDRIPLSRKKGDIGIVLYYLIRCNRETTILHCVPVLKSLLLSSKYWDYSVRIYLSVQPFLTGLVDWVVIKLLGQ